MIRNYRALVLDDNPEWRELLSLSLAQLGAQVDVTATPEEFRERLDRNSYHLLVFDISLHRGWDSDGLDLLLDLYKTVRIDAAAVIVVSGYANVDRTVAALAGRPTTTLIEKQTFNHRAFTETARELLARSVPINLDLQVDWQHAANVDASGLEILHNLKVGRDRIKKNSEQFALISEEFEDLLARTFYNAERIVITPMSPGRSGAGVAKVQPFLKTGGGGAPVVLKFGDVNDIEQENKNFADYVQPFLQGGRITSIYRSAHTWRLGATCYSLLGNNEFDDFKTFYRKSSDAEIRMALRRLFLETCKGWYDNRRQPRPRNLGREYRERLGCDVGGLTEALQKLGNVQGTKTLHFNSLNPVRKLRNPIPAVGDEQMVYSTHECLTHGDLNESNVLVDQGSNCWLIDFLNTGPAHVLRDFALMDTAIRVTLLGPSEATLAEREEMELAVAAARELDENDNLRSDFTSENPAVRKAFNASLVIRSLAARVTQKRNFSELPDFDVATMFYGLNLIRFMHLGAVQREHGLLSAAMSAERLGL